MNIWGNWIIWNILTCRCILLTPNRYVSFVLDILMDFMQHLPVSVLMDQFMWNYISSFSENRSSFFLRKMYTWKWTPGREYRQKTFVTLSGFWPLKGGGLGESVKKAKAVTEIFFQIILKEFLKSCKKWHLLI